MDQFTKQLSEVFFIEADFVQVLRTAEALVLGSCTAVAYTRDGADSTTDVLEAASKAVSESKLQIRVKAGAAADSPYKITLKAVTDQGNTWEKDIGMTVKEI